VKYLASVMVRECFSSMQGGLCFLSKNCTMNGKRYKMVLEDRLNSLMRVHWLAFSLQDCAPCHKNKLVMAFFKQAYEEFVILDLPGISLDLNPTENGWSYMKKKLKANSNITYLPKQVEAIKLMLVRDIHGNPLPTARSWPAPCQGDCRWWLTRRGIDQVPY
jgi:hypothetical protein